MPDRGLRRLHYSVPRRHACNNVTIKDFLDVDVDIVADHHTIATYVRRYGRHEREPEPLHPEV